MDLPPVTPEMILWLGVPPLASIGVALCALFARRGVVQYVLIVIGVGGFIVSVLWFLLALRIEAVEKRSLEGRPALGAVSPRETA